LRPIKFLSPAEPMPVFEIPANVSQFTHQAEGIVVICPQ
jgi:hypothetical protein